MMIRKTNANGIGWYEFPHFSPTAGIVHGVFTRRKGSSRPPFDSLNVSLSNGDRPGHVHANRVAIKQVLGADHLVFCKQVHGTGVVVVNDRLEAPPTGDAMITALPGHLLVIQVADCQPVLLADPAQRVVANIHSGWRGSCRDIIARTIAAMVSEFGCRPADMVAGIGPSLGPCCAEFVHYRDELPESLWRYQTRPHHFDFWRISNDQLTAAGLDPANIVTSGLCTRCRPDLFFSYRHAKTTGRFAAAIGIAGLKNDE